MQTTIRFHMNPDKVNLAHNTNEEVRSKEKHVRSDPKTGHALEIWCQNYSSGEEAIADILSEDLENYNKKVRKSRRMTMEQYIQHVKDDKRGNGHKVKYKKSDGTYGYKSEKRDEKRILYEVIISCGNTSRYEYDEFGKARYDRNKGHIRPQEVPYEVNYAVCKRYYESFEKRNPNLKMVHDVLHNEEGFFNKHHIWEYGTAHSHIGFVPIGTGYKQGLARQVSIGRALENMGYKDTYEEVLDKDGNPKIERVCAYTLWEREEEKYLEELLQEEYEKYCRKHKVYAIKHGKLEIIHPVKGRKVDPLSPEEYAERQRLTEEIAELSGQAEDYKETLSELADKAVIPKKRIFKKSKKIILTEDELAAVKHNADVVKEMEFNKISSNRHLQKAQKESEFAEEKSKAAESLYDEEENLIQKQAQKLQQKYEDDTGHEKEKYTQLCEKEKLYILNMAKKIAEKIIPYFAKLDLQEQKRIIARTYNEINCDSAKPDEPELC